MKDFYRDDLRFSLCGLNCALCSMKLGGHCPGCGGGAGNQGCPIARCAVERGIYSYCCDCESYPCGRYDGITRCDSFITHRNQLPDMQRFRECSAAYHAQLEEKTGILKFLLERYNDGRRKTLFCLAVNLLELEVLRDIIARLDSDAPPEAETKDRAQLAAKYLEAAAAARGITLKLNKNRRQMQMTGIKTERLAIAPMTDAELAYLTELYTDIPELCLAYTEMLGNCRSHPQEWLWYTSWKICLTDGTAEIGYAGFKGYNGGVPEIGYGINDEFTGKGYATEAVKALCEWALGMPGVTAVEAEIEEDNARSRRVLVKCGFTVTGVRGEEGPRYRYKDFPDH